MFIPCACDRGVESIVHTPECGSRRFFCIDGVHLDCLDPFLLETNSHTHTHTHTPQNDKTRNGRAQLRCDSRVVEVVCVCARMHDKRTRVHSPVLLRSRVQVDRLALKSAACRRLTGRRVLRTLPYTSRSFQRWYTFSSSTRTATPRRGRTRRCPERAACTL